MSANILCLDDDDGVLVSIRAILHNRSGYSIKTAQNWERAALILETEPIDMMLLDVNLGRGNQSGIDLLPIIKKKYPNLDIIIVTGERDGELFTTALKRGAADYYTKPIQSDLLLAVRKLEIKRENEQKCEALYSEVSNHYVLGEKEFIGRAPIFLKILEKAARLKGKQASVLIEAETGTGKELLAKHIHNLEQNSKRPFIIVNCATLPENLIESELLGHEKGSFTGAISKKIGKFQLAHGGDIFLDEINSLRHDLQAKLLRVLQDKIVYPIGSKTPVDADCRIIAATNENLKKLVDAGRFREDLYHRLNVVKLILPPLRDRKEDIPLLVDYFIHKYDRPHKNKKISAAAMKYLMNYDWPGNVRELENQIHSLVVLTSNKVMDVNDLPEHIINRKVHPAITESIKVLEKSLGSQHDLFNLKIDEYTKIMRYQYVRHAIEKNGGCVKQASKALGMARSSLYNIINEVKRHEPE